METKKEYFKANRKSAKTSAIRYDLAKFDIATKRSGIPTIQALFDFLLDRYANEGVVNVAQIERDSMPQSVSKVSNAEKEPSWQNYKFFAGRIKSIDSHEEAVEFILDIESSTNLTSAEVAKLKELLKVKSGG
jgi:hypothetical protein